MDGFTHAIGGDGGDAIIFLDPLGGGFTNEQIVMAAHIGNDGLVHLVAAHAHRSGVGKPAQGQHGDFGSAAANIDNHAAHRFGHRHIGANGGGHGFENQVNLAGAGIAGGIANGAAFNAG